MPGDELEKLRLELAAIGERRAIKDIDIKQLAKDTREAVKRAKGKLPVTEVAQLVGIERTTLYRVYRES